MADAGFRALVENAPDAIVVSRQGVVLYANAAAARLLGHDDVSELVGKPMAFLDRRSLEVMRRRIEQMAATGERLVPREYPARRRDGTEITAEIASTLIEFEGAPAVLAYARDVTERTRLRAQLAHSDRLAALGTMAAGVAHEINNPLSFLGLATEMLGTRVGPGEAALVAEVRAGIDRIAAIVRDLRFFGRDDDDAPGAVDLVAAIEVAEHLVMHEIRPRGRLEKQLGEVPAIVGVPRHVEQVFVNLFLNAALALDERTGGQIVVRSRVTADRVQVLVEDDGCGMAKEVLDVVFEPFFTTRTGGRGTGLGLSICRDLVVRTGGDLVARSTVGVGTTMEVTFVRASAETAAVRPPPDVAPGLVAPLPPRLPSGVRAGGPARRVLVVDDEPLIVRALVERLTAHATVVGETVPERALDLILRADPGFDVIVCDVTMPGMSGIDLHARVAAEKPERATRFVFMTGGTFTERAREYLGRVPNPCIDKPFGVAQLVEAMERVGST